MEMAAFKEGTQYMVLDAGGNAFKSVKQEPTQLDDEFILNCCLHYILINKSRFAYFPFKVDIIL